MTSRTLWPAALIGVLALTVVANGVLVYEATRGEPAAAEADYYQRALNWDSTMAQARVNAELQWRVRGQLGADGEVRVEVADREGAPITQAQVEAEGFALVGGDSYRFTLHPGPDGDFRGRVLDRRPGLHEIRLTIQTPDHRVTAVLRGTPGSSLEPHG